MLYVTLLFWSTEYECDVGYNCAKRLIRDNKAILENVHSTQYKKLPVRQGQEMMLHDLWNGTVDQYQIVLTTPKLFSLMVDKLEVIEKSQKPCFYVKNKKQNKKLGSK